MLIAGTISFFLGGCSSTMPQYRSADNAEHRFADTDVNYRIDPVLAHEGIDCLAIMPLSITPAASAPVELVNLDLRDRQANNSQPVHRDEIYPLKLQASDKQKILRNSLLAYVSPYETRDIELAEIDRWLTPGLNPDYKDLAKKLDCNWFLEGKIKRFSSSFFGVYSNIVIAADLKIIRGQDSKTVWQGHHEARSDDGSFPLTLMDLAFGAMRAAHNVNPEQLERTVADLARRLTRTMPLEKDNSFLFAAKRNHLLEVIASRLNLRSGPGQHYTVNRVLKNKETVALLEPSNEESWLFVQTTDGQTGYVFSSYLN